MQASANVTQYTPISSNRTKMVNRTHATFRRQSNMKTTLAAFLFAIMTATACAAEYRDDLEQGGF